MKSNFRQFIAIALTSLIALNSVLAAPWAPGSQSWEYNPGPDPATAAGRQLIDLYAELPEYSEISRQMMDDQKFRYIFGLMMTRTYFEKNEVKVLFVGQDATHIAEAAKQPGTSGFGARVQSIGNFFGVDQSVATTNAFLSTIKGQYGSFDHPYVELDESGKPQVRQSAFVDNQLWLLANGKNSEIRKKREAFWEWMIKNNPDSMRMFVMFGGAARDAWAEFLIARGAKVGTRIQAAKFKKIRVPESRLVYAGGNNEFPVPVDRSGKDIYEILLGRKPKYENLKDQEAAVEALKAAGTCAIEMMTFTGGGFQGSGILNPAQLGGYDLENVWINGRKTNSLKGLTLSDGTVIQNDIAFTMSPHPSSLSKMDPAMASASLKKSFARLQDLKSAGWKIEPDVDDEGQLRRNLWDEGQDYSYGRADIRAGYFEFGAPEDRRVSRADASRLDPQVIVAGSRDRVQFDMNLINAAKVAQPSSQPDPKDLWSVRPRQKLTRYVFDRGPGPEIAKALVTSLDRDALFKPKQGMKVITDGRDLTFETHGIQAYNTKTHPETGFFGFHRGSFQKFRVLILADPHGIDDWNTSRALTGARGQYLHGLMEDLGVGEDYLVIKTVPVGMDGATAEEWEYVRSRSEKYRETAVSLALKNSKPEVIITDGDIAKSEINRILNQLKIKDLKVVSISRNSMDPSTGIKEAGEVLKAQIPNMKTATLSLKMRDIPRSHLPWWSRSWEGTSGDRVFDATGKYKGGVRALVAPNWVAEQRVQITPEVQESIRLMKAELDQAGLRSGGEVLPNFLSRKQLDGQLKTETGLKPQFEVLTGGLNASEPIRKCSAYLKRTGS